MKRAQIKNGDIAPPQTVYQPIIQVYRITKQRIQVKAIPTTTGKHKQSCKSDENLIE